MYKIISAEKFLWENLNLDGKQVLEGGTSWGNTTRIVAKKIKENNWQTKLISIDIDDSHFNEIEKDIGDDFEELKLRKGDLSDLHFVATGSIDVVICNYTLSSVNQFPLRAVRALKELYRVLKPKGQFLITEEMPIWSVDNSEYEYWSKRLRVIKSISNLKGMAQFNEMHPTDLESTLGILGFKEIEWSEFKEKINSEMATKFLDKRKQTLIKAKSDINNEKLTEGYVEVTEALVKEFERAKEFPAPAYILKAVK